MKYYFIYKETDLIGKETGKVITHQFEGDSLETLLSNFQDFLKGAGFYFDGNVDIVKDDDWDTAPISIDISEEEDIEHSKYYYDTDRNKQMSFDFRV